MSNGYYMEFCKKLGEVDFIDVLGVKAYDKEVNVLCRVDPKEGKKWASLVYLMLRTARTEEFEALVHKRYFLKGERLVYGWNVDISSNDPDLSSQKLIEAIFSSFGGVSPSTHSEPKVANKDVMDRYSPPLDADAKGNPIVNRQVKSIVFAGMEGVKDRNVIGKNGKGAKECA